MFLAKDFIKPCPHFREDFREKIDGRAEQGKAEDNPKPEPASAGLDDMDREQNLDEGDQLIAVTEDQTHMLPSLFIFSTPRSGLGWIFYTREWL